MGIADIIITAAAVLTVAAEETLKLAIAGAKICADIAWFYFKPVWV